VADFDSKQSTFWGAVAASFWFGSSLLQYLAAKKAKKLQQKEENMNESVEQKAGQYGIKETKEVVIAANEIAVLIVKKLRDGVQVQDGVDVASALFMDGDIKNAVNAAAENIKDVPNEIKDLDIQEGIELGMCQISYVPKFIDALKK